MKRLISAVLASATILLTTSIAPASADTTLHIESATVHKTGAGAKAIVLIPGLGSGPFVYDGVVGELAQRMTVYNVAFDGFDGAPAGKAPYLASFTQSIVDLIAQEHLVKPLVVGHSLGGHIAVRLAETIPTQLGAVMAIDSLPLFPLAAPGETPASRKAGVAAFQAAMTNAPQAAFEAQSRASIAMLVTDPKNVDIVNAHSLKSDRATFVGAAVDMELEDLTPDLAKISVPLTVLEPASAYTPEQTAAFYGNLYAGVPHLSVVPIANSKHFAMLDQPAAFRAALDAFVAANSH